MPLDLQVGHLDHADWLQLGNVFGNLHSGHSSHCKEVALVGAHMPVEATEPVGGWTTESVTHGQCDARPTVTFPATEHHRPLAGTKLYCLVTRAHGFEQQCLCYILSISTALLVFAVLNIYTHIVGIYAY